MKVFDKVEETESWASLRKGRGRTLHNDMITQAWKEKGMVPDEHLWKHTMPTQAEKDLTDYLA